MLKTTIILLTVLINIQFQFGLCYSAKEDARIIREYKLQQQRNAADLAVAPNHAKTARRLVHESNWASMGTISVNNAIKDYPMVNVISVNDNDELGQSTGKIQFLLTDLDFTGTDWQHDNKVTMLFSEEQGLNCSNHLPNKIDPMEPICARTIISGQVVKMNQNDKNYEGALASFVERHPASKNWLKAHLFYLCELNIINIFVLDFYGGPHTVTASQYYNETL